MARNQNNPEAPVLHEDLDELLVALAVTCAEGLPPSAIRMLEERIPGAKPGDVLSGKVVFMMLNHFTDRVEVEYIAAGTPGRHALSVDLFTGDDIRALAEPFKLLDSWAKASKPRRSQ